MKTLYYLRHSLKGPDNNITPEGIELAKAQGRVLADIPFSRIFVGPLIGTDQTASAFFHGHPGNAYYLEHPIGEIGNDDLFKEISNAEFKEAVKAGKSNLEALLAVHHSSKVELWAEMGFAAVRLMFDYMVEGQVAVAFGHSPMIELAAYSIEEGKLDSQFRRLGEMEGIVFLDGPPTTFPQANIMGTYVHKRIGKP